MLDSGLVTWLVAGLVAELVVGLVAGERVVKVKVVGVESIDELTYEVVENTELG